MEHKIDIKRAYDAASPGDGFRIYIDRLWPEFASRYKAELNANPAFQAMLQTIADKPKVTLLYSSHNRAHNNAVVVEELLAGAGWQPTEPE